MSHPSAPSTDSTSSAFWRWAPGVLIAVATALAYSNSFGVPFVFDDVLAIFDNPTLGSIWTALLHPPSGYGLTVSGRPVLNASLAISHAISGSHPWGYHALNLLIHLAAALALYGAAWRTLRRLPGREARLGRPKPFALGLALLWALHPLQTESVTYVVQRAESLMGLFFLLTFYAFIRSLESPRPLAWRMLALAACLLGAGTKEVIALVPPLLVLYDRAFVAGSFREVWRLRRWTHVAFFCTWLPLGLAVFGQGGDRGGTFALHSWGAASTYWLAQFEAVSRYLWLSVVPWPQSFEYGFPVPLAPVWLALCILVVGLTLAATLEALVRAPRLGFLGAWFFGILAPTSVVPGTLQAIVEHRMYLPLAAVLALVATGLASALGRRTVPLLLALAVAAGTATWFRNGVYRDDLTLWQDALRKRPMSAIAQANVGTALYNRGRIEEALPFYRRSLELNPKNPATHYNLGLALAKLGRHAEALPSFDRTLELNPRFFLAHFRKGISLRELGRPEEAYREFLSALRIKPDLAEGYEEIAALLIQQQRWSDAERFCREALSFQANLPGAQANLGIARYHQGDLPGAEQALRAAIHDAPELAEAHFNLGLVAAAAGRPDEAVQEYAEAVRLKPEFVDARLNLGIARAQAGRLPEALEQLQQAARLAPGRADVQRNLANALFEAGQLGEAIAAYQRALEAAPDHAPTHLNLANALLAARRLPEARDQFQAAARLDPTQGQAREMADKLTAYLREQGGG